MRIHLRRCGVGILVVWLILKTLQPAWASTAIAPPANSLQLLVGYAPGGLADRLARLAAAQLSQELKQPITVKNLMGASGVRAGLEALKSHDGAVLLFADSSLIVAHQVLEHAPDLRRFGPVGTVGFTPFAISVSAASPLKSLPELLDFMRQNPSQAHYGSPGVYSVHQLSAEMWLQKAQVKAQHIPYPGGAPMLSDLLQQRLTFGLVSIQLAQQQAGPTQLRVLAVTGPSRSPQMPEVPALSEFYPRLSAVSTGYLVAAPNMAPSQYNNVVTAWQQVMTHSDMKQGLEKAGMEGGMGNDQEASAMIRQETERWRQTLQHMRID